MTSSDLDDWWRTVTESRDRRPAIHDAYQSLENAGLLGHVVVQRYLCRSRGCVLATVISVGGSIIARTRDNKLAPGTNRVTSVESARRTRTLDADRHWPGVTVDIGALASVPEAALEMNCRHGLRVVPAAEVLEWVKNLRPGHPGPPTRFRAAADAPLGCRAPDAVTLV